MSKLTATDNKNLALFQLHQKTVFRRNALLKNAPFIGGSTVIKIFKCSDEYVYEDPVAVDSPLPEEKSIADMAIVTDWRFTAVGCRSVINCNRYFPKGGVCAGLDAGESPSTDRDECFSFTTPKGQTVDACHPMCYHPSAGEDNYIGVYTEYFGGRCFACDSLLLAFYLDPERRVVEPARQIVEKEALSVRLRPVGPLSEPAYVATIDPEYCNQYGLRYAPDDGRSSDGIKLFNCVVDANSDSAFSVSNVAGNVIARAINMGEEALKELIEKTSKRPKIRQDPTARGAPTQPFLASADLWKANVDATKKQLPFPLTLTALGIVSGTRTEWLVWTDEYSHLDDGRNDQFGGRLVERSKPVARPRRSFGGNVSAAAPKRPDNAAPADQSFARDNVSRRQRRDAYAAAPSDRVDGIDEMQKRLMLNLQRSTKDYSDQMKTAGQMSKTLSTTDSVNGLNKILATMSAEDLRALAREFQEESAKTTGILGAGLRRLVKTVGGRVSTKAVGYAMSNAAMRVGLERGLVRRASNWLKTPFKTVGAAANILNIVGLIGVASDLFAMFVYDPYGRYKRHFSDAALLKLAETELVANQRNIGVRRVYITPHDWMVNTEYMETAEDAFYDMALAVMYMTSRRVNSSGGAITWDEYGELDAEDDLLWRDEDGLGADGGAPDPVEGASDRSLLARGHTEGDKRTHHHPRHRLLRAHRRTLTACALALVVSCGAVCLSGRRNIPRVYPVTIASLSLLAIAFPPPPL